MAAAVNSSTFLEPFRTVYFRITKPPEMAVGLGYLSLMKVSSFCLAIPSVEINPPVII